MGNCLSAKQNIPDSIRPLGFCCETLHQFWCETVTVIAWLTTYVYWLLLRNFAPVLVWNVLRWSPDWPRMTIGFCCETLHQFWCETVTVIAWLTTYDYWLLLRNFAPVLVWNCYGDRLTDHVRLLTFAAKLCTSSGVNRLRWLHYWLLKTTGFCCETERSLFTLISGVNVNDERGNHPPHIETRVKYRKRYLTLRARFSAVRG